MLRFIYPIYAKFYLSWYQVPNLSVKKARPACMQEIRKREKFLIRSSYLYTHIWQFILPGYILTSTNTITAPCFSILVSCIGTDIHVYRCSHISATALQESPVALAPLISTSPHLCLICSQHDNKDAAITKKQIRSPSEFVKISGSGIIKTEIKNTSQKALDESHPEILEKPHHHASTHCPP